MKLRVDCHLHPCLPESDKKALEKCKKWWGHIKELGIDGIIVSEHIYNNPARAFYFMNKTKPKDLFCFPGMEYITKKGIDINIFSNNEKIYSLKELIPFNLAYEEIIDLILSQDNLFGYITHPYSLRIKTVINVFGKKKYNYFTEKLGAIEIANGGLNIPLALLEKFPFKFIFKFLIKKIKNRKNLPLEDYPKQVKFLAAGSDAHSFGALGTCLEIEVKNKQDIFYQLTHNRGKVVFLNKKLNLLSLVKDYFLPEIYYVFLDKKNQKISKQKTG